MGLKDQFQDKAKQLAEQARAKAQGAPGLRDETSGRSSQAGQAGQAEQAEQDTKARADRTRDAFDSGFED
ncbi:hypothetical protein AB0D94_29710 [Streptomyces sp. NPDC048255]|uniref:hypothetical protein n=1 Tax=Streptomyces sp. NPDC048255 TaxID=3154713 RepID=UPI0033DF0862